jgi:ketosteroid isomerase-like protein
VARAIQASLTGDSSVVARVFTPDVHASLPPSVTCAAELAVEIEDRRDVFADVELSVASSESRGERTWVEWHAEVTHVGSLFVEEALIPATGRRVDVRGITVAEFEGERIARFRQYWDWSGLLHEEEPR